jgi:hypothetical protein
MATITTLANPLSIVPTALVRHMDNSNWTYVEWKEIDLAAAVTAKGSALAAADVIEAVRVAPGQMVLAAWVEKTSVLTGTVSVLTVNVGFAGGSGYLAAWDGFGAALTAQTGASVNTVIPTTTVAGDTIDLTIASLTGTLTGGKIKVGVLVLDLNTKSRGIIAAPKS